MSCHHHFIAGFQMKGHASCTKAKALAVCVDTFQRSGEAGQRRVRESFVVPQPVEFRNFLPFFFLSDDRLGASRHQQHLRLTHSSVLRSSMSLDRNSISSSRSSITGSRVLRTKNSTSTPQQQAVVVSYKRPQTQRFTEPIRFDRDEHQKKNNKKAIQLN